MSAGSIPLPRRISDAQFVGDLFGLFKRHRIDTGEAGSFAQFESLLATKDTFRSQLFTLCTAISHMADADLSGEQLLDLVARALGGPEITGGVPESARQAFLSGYAAWSNRGMEEPEVWPPVRNAPASNGPIPFPQPAEDPLEVGVPATRTHGIRTVQEALLMARTETPFELPERGAAATARVNGVNVEGLTINELTKLLEDIERQMSRIKPAVHQLNGLFVPGGEPLERQGRGRDSDDSAAFRAAASAGPLRPSLVTPAAVILETPEPLLIGETRVLTPEEDKFLARHLYLQPGRRLPPDTPDGGNRTTRRAVPRAPRPAAVAPAAPSAAVVVAAAAPASAVEAEGVAAPAVAPAGSEVAARPKRTRGLPEVLLVDDPPWAPIAVVPKKKTVRLRYYFSIGLTAAILLVGCPLAGIALFQYLFPERHYEYHDLQPVDPPSPDAADVSPEPPAQVVPGPSSEQPEVRPAAAGTHAAGATHSKGAHAVRGVHPTPKPVPPVAVWPPPPQ